MNKSKKDINKTQCPECRSRQVYMTVKKGLVCRKCGWKEKPDTKITSRKEKIRIVNLILSKIDDLEIYDEQDQILLSFDKCPNVITSKEKFDKYYNSLSKEDKKYFTDFDYSDTEFEKAEQDLRDVGKNPDDIKLLIKQLKRNSK